MNSFGALEPSTTLTLILTVTITPTFYYNMRSQLRNFIKKFRDGLNYKF